MSRANLAAVFERSEFSKFAANVNFQTLRNLASNELFFTPFFIYSKYYYILNFQAFNKPSFVFVNHFSRIIITYNLQRLTLKESEQPLNLSYLVLLQRGFTKLFQFPKKLVVSYTTFSPLPKWRSIFCGTFLKITFSSRQLPFCSMELGLSSVIMTAINLNT